MSFIVELLGNVLTGLAAQTIANVAGKVIDALRNSTKGMKSSEVKGVLAALGTTSPETIRELVNQEFAKDRRITTREKEDVSAVLIALARGATLVNSQGDPRSIYVRSEELLERLLDSIKPARRAGEPVFPNDTWQLQQFLGRGAFGEVWLAYNRHTKGKRAYKFFTREGALDWLRAETERLQSVGEKLQNHPQIVRLFDVGTPEHGYPFLALEYVAGGSLEEWISDAEKAKRPLRKAEIMRGIIRAVAAAHGQQIYHCDLKPANILLTAPPDVQPKIADFGLSCLDGPDGSEDSSAAIFAGTLAYLPPEAFRPFAERKPALSDVFAVGVIWYQLLTEKLERPSYDFAAELSEAGADSHTIALVSCCLAHPERRFRDAILLAEQMDKVDLPVWNPVPPSLYDVQDLVREYVAQFPK